MIFYKIFHDSPARRADFQEINGFFLFPGLDKMFMFHVHVCVMYWESWIIFHFPEYLKQF